MATCCVDYRITGLALGSIIATVILRVTIEIAFSVGFIAPVLVAHEVRKREPVMCRYKIDTGCRAATAGFENVGRSVYAPGEFGSLARIAAPETP